jgi:hypothetical protein
MLMLETEKETSLICTEIEVIRGYYEDFEVKM